MTKGIQNLDKENISRLREYGSNILVWSARDKKGEVLRRFEPEPDKKL
mgnify:CR=1 FL=1